MAYCRLDDVVQGLELEIRNDVIGKLVRLAGSTAARQAVANLQAEELVDREIWHRLIEKLISSIDEWQSIHDGVVEVMRSDQLNGPEATCSTDIVFGRATSESDLAMALTENGHYGSVASASEQINDLKGVPVAELRQAWSSYKLGRYVMWATFDANGKDPFAAMAWEADHIRAHLGLPRSDVGKPLLLLRYKLPHGKARMARVTEAYSGETWSHYFRTAGLKEQRDGYGLTFPWDDLADGEGVGVPEVVHEPIEGQWLVDCVFEVK